MPVRLTACFGFPLLALTLCLAPAAQSEVAATRPAEDAERALRQSATQARGIHQGCILYAQGANTRFPPDIATLLNGNYFTPAYTISPQEHGKSIPADFAGWPAEKRSEWINKNTSYVLLPGLVDDTDSKKIAIFEKLHTPTLKRIPVVFNDNHYDLMEIAQADAAIRAQTGRSLADWTGLVSYERANKLYLDSKFDEAIKVYTAAIKNEPSDKRAPDAMYLIGRSYENLGKKDEAIEAYKKMLAKYPDHDSAAAAKKRLEALGAAEGK